MAIAYSIVKRGATGNFKQNVVDVTLDATYAAGGYALDAASCGVREITGAAVIGTTGDGLLPLYNPTTGKLVLHKGASTVTVTSGNAALTEPATNDSLVSSSVVVRLLVVGSFATG